MMATKAAEAPSNDSSDAVLDEFFSEIEKLQISEEQEDEDRSTQAGLEHHSNALTTTEEPGEASEEDSETTYAASTSLHPTEAPKLNKKELVKRAETRKQSWQTFSLSQKQQEGITVADRPKISFTIGAKKSKSKKKNSKALKGETDKEKEVSKPPPQLVAFQKPRWVAVLDTCVVLETYDAVCGLIAAAQQYSDIEHVSIVIPYKLWNELDYQIKQGGATESDNDESSRQYRARRAVRMLTAEQQRRVNGGRTATADNASVTARSQSRTEMDQAALEFRGGSAKDVIINNDDHILFCARAEQKRYHQATGGAGGVVLLTLDNVLSGKARADQVTVYTASVFLEYYQRRMASIQDRTRQRQMDPAMQWR